MSSGTASLTSHFLPINDIWNIYRPFSETERLSAIAEFLPGAALQ